MGLHFSSFINSSVLGSWIHVKETSPLESSWTNLAEEAASGTHQSTTESLTNSAISEPLESLSEINLHDSSNPVKIPDLFSKNPGLEDRMTQYCIKYCPSVTPEQMKNFIEMGETIEGFIVQNMNGKLPIIDGKVSIGDIEIPIKQAVVSVVWLLMAKAGKYNEHFTNGAFRIDDSNKKLENFLHHCGENYKMGTAFYPRVSSHMNEHQIHSQFGFDLNNSGLPAEKHTLLLHKLDDGTLYLKIETSGVPPFWQKEYRSFENVKNFVHHLGLYAITRFRPSEEMKPARKEHTPKNIRQEFTEFMQDVAKPRSLFSRMSSIFRQATAQEIAIQKLTERGCKHGISQIDKILKEDLPRLTAEQQNKRAALIAKLENSYFKKQADRGYTGKIKGEEVILPALGQ